MSKEIGRYNTELHLFEERSLVKLKTLEFNRWLAEKQGRTLSAPAGAFALAEAVVSEPVKAPLAKRTIVPGD